MKNPNKRKSRIEREREHMINTIYPRVATLFKGIEGLAVSIADSNNIHIGIERSEKTIYFVNIFGISLKNPSDDEIRYGISRDLPSRAGFIEDNAMAELVAQTYGENLNSPDAQYVLEQRKKVITRLRERKYGTYPCPCLPLQIST